MDRPALFAPLLEGVNVSPRVQLVPAATANGSVPQLPATRTNCAESTPLTTILLKVSVAVPPLETVSVCEPELPTLMEPNDKLVVGAGGDALTVIAATPPVPEPVSEIVVGLPEAPCTMESVPRLSPLLSGVNVTPTVQLDPAPRIAGKAPQLLAVGTNCVLSPETFTLCSVRDAVPLFVSVSVCVLEVPNACGLKTRPPVDAVKAPTPPAPVPARATAVRPTL
jgi:hypothetical protein